MSEKNQTLITEIPIFPLPNTVFFPKTLLPLHIFEPRYRSMVEDARANENLIGMVLLKSGWEKDYFGNPQVHDIACVGEIQYTEKLQDGKYNIMLYGLSRVRILKFVQSKPYRVAQVKYLKETRFDPHELNEHEESESFINLVRTYLTEVGVDDPDELLELQSHSLESIVNHVACILDFSTAEKQMLLEADILSTRYEKVKKLLWDRLTVVRVARNVKIVPDDPSLN